MRLGEGNEGVSVCETPRVLRELITANCRDEVQQLELPIDAKKRRTQSLHANELLFFTETEMSSLSAPHPSFLWLPDSWQGQIYSSESFVGADELAPSQSAEAALFKCGVSPLSVALMES